MKVGKISVSNEVKVDIDSHSAVELWSDPASGRMHAGFIFIGEIAGEESRTAFDRGWLLRLGKTDDLSMATRAASIRFYCLLFARLHIYLFRIFMLFI